MTNSTKAITAKTKLVITKTGSRYNPSSASAQDNAATWELLVAALPATYGELQAIAKERNHSPFVGYAVRRGWLAAS